MTQLMNPIRQTFLKDLGVPVKPKKKFSFPKFKLTQEQKLNQNLINSFEAYQKEEVEILKGIQEIKTELEKEQYKAVPGRDKVVPGLLTDLKLAQKIATEAKTKQEAQDLFKQAAFHLDKIHQDADHAIKNLEKYIDLEARAQKYRGKLFAKNRPPHTKFHKPLEDLLTEAKNLAASGNHSNAVKKLEYAKKLYEACEKKVVEAKKLDLGRAQYEPVYKVVLQRAKDGLDELKDLPGAQGAHDGIKDKITKAENEAKAGQYQAAYDLLKGIDKDIKNGHKSAQSFHDKAGNKAYQSALKLAEQEYKTLANLIDVCDPGKLAKYRFTLDGSLKALEPSKTKVIDDKKITNMITVLEEATKKMQKDIQKFEEKKKSAIDLYNELNQSIGKELGGWMPLEEFTPWNTRLLASRTLIGAGQYDFAIEEFEQLKKDTKDLHKKYAAKAKQWDDLLVEYKKHKPIIDEGLKHTFFMAIQSAASSIETHREVSELRLKQTHDFDEVCKLFRQTLDEKIPTVKKGLEQFERLKDAIEDLKKTHNEEVGKVNTEIEKLRGQGGDTEAFQKRLEDEKDAFSKACSGLLGKEAKDITTAKDNTVKALQKIATDIGGVLNDPAALDNSKKSATAKKLQAEGQKLESEVKGLIKEVSYDDTDKANVYTEDLKNAGSNYDQTHIDNLTKIKNKIQTALENFKRDSDKLKQQSKTAAEEVESIIKRLESGTSVLGRGSHKEYNPYFVSLKDEIQDALAMCDSRILDVAKAGKQKLDDLKKQVEDLQKENESSDPNAKNYAAVDKVLKDVEKLLKDKNLIACREVQAKVLAHRFKESLKTQVYSLSPEGALAPDGPLMEFKKEVEEAIQEARNRMDKRKKLKEDGEKLLNKLKGLAGLRSDSAFRKQLEGQINSAMNPGENKEEIAEKNMENYAKQLQQAEDPQNIEILEQTANQRLFEAEKQKAAWESKKAIYDTTTKKDLKEAYDNANKKTVDTDRYNKVVLAYKDAVKHAKKKNYFMANQSLEEAVSEATRFIASPQGATFTARNRLPQIYKGWQQAVSAFLGNVTKVKKAITEAAESDGFDTKKTITILDGATRMFDARRFDQTVGDITDPNSDTKKLRAAKERGLQYLRQYRKLLDTDPVLAHLRENPFTAFTTIMLDDKIRDFELNLLRA